MLIEYPEYTNVYCLAIKRYLLTIELKDLIALNEQMRQNKENKKRSILKKGNKNESSKPNKCNA